MAKKTPPKKDIKKPVKKTAAPKKVAAKAPAKAAAKKPAPAKPAKQKASGKKPAPQKNQQKTKGGAQEEVMRDKIVAALDKMKAEDIMCIDVRELSSLTDFMVIATGRSNRQVKAIADSARDAFMTNGVRNVRMEGTGQADWVVVDGGDVIVHVFRPEVRQFYRLEEVWGMEPPLQETFRNL